jgi:hypothetical protein
VYRFFARVLEEGQTWVVFGLVGKFGSYKTNLLPS